MMSGALPLLLVITPVSLLLEELTCVLLSWWLVDVMMLPGVLLVKVEVRLSKNIGGQYCLKQTMKNEETNCTREMYALKIHLPYNKHNTVASGTSPVHAEQGEFFLPPPNLLVWAFTGTLGNTTMTTIRTSQHSVQMETCNEQCPSRVHTGIGTTGISTTCVLMTRITAPSRVVQVTQPKEGIPSRGTWMGCELNCSARPSAACCSWLQKFWARNQGTRREQIESSSAEKGLKYCQMKSSVHLQSRKASHAGLHQKEASRSREMIVIFYSALLRASGWVLP